MLTEYGFTQGTAEESRRRYGGDRPAALRNGIARPWVDLAGQTPDPPLWGARELLQLAPAAGVASWGAPGPGARGGLRPRPPAGDHGGQRRGRAVAGLAGGGGLAGDAESARRARPRPAWPTPRPGPRASRPSRGTNSAPAASWGHRMTEGSLPGCVLLVAAAASSWLCCWRAAGPPAGRPRPWRTGSSSLPPACFEQVVPPPGPVAGGQEAAPARRRSGRADPASDHHPPAPIPPSPPRPPVVPCWLTVRYHRVEVDDQRPGGDHPGRPGLRQRDGARPGGDVRLPAPRGAPP